MNTIRWLKTLQIGGGFMGVVHPKGAGYANDALALEGVPIRYANHTICANENKPNEHGVLALDYAQEVGGFEEQLLIDQEQILHLIATGGFDLVRVVVPDAFHQAYAVAALEAGAHVISEKCLAHSIASGKIMVDAAAEHSATAKAVVAYNYRGFKAVQRFHQLITEGRIFNLDCISYRAIVDFLQDWGYADRKDWRFIAALAGLCGVIGDLGGHAIDLILWCLGCDEVVEVSATTHYFKGEHDQLVKVDGANADHENLCVDAFAATLHMKSGSMITIGSGRDCKGEKANQRMELFGCYGKVGWGLHDGQWLEFYEHTLPNEPDTPNSVPGADERTPFERHPSVPAADRGTKRIHHERWVPGLSGDFYVGHGEQDLKLAKWLANDCQGACPVADFAHGFETLLICEAIRQAGISHGRVTIDSVRPN